MPIRERYWLRLRYSPWREVSRREYIRAERKAGYHRWWHLKPSTYSFSNGEIAARITHEDVFKKYSWDPDFLTVVRNEEYDASAKISVS